MLNGSTTNMKLIRKTLNVQKWYSGSLKIVLLVLFFSCLCNVSSGSSSRNPVFAIEFIHYDCGRYIHPSTVNNVPDNDQLHLWYGVHSNTHFVFDQVDGKWGYIRHTLSGKVWHPKGGSSYTRYKGTKIVLHSDRQRYNLFAIDQVSGNIQHRDGYYVNVKSNSCSDGADIHLWDDAYSGDGAWKFVNPYKSSASEEVLPYGDFKVFGEWQLVYSQDNPLVTQTVEFTHKVGRSESESTRRKFAFNWQFKASMTYFVQMETSISLSAEIESASSTTWFEERTVKETMTVEAGQPIAVWRRVFIGEQLGNREVFQSNIIRHTKGSSIKPSDNDSRTPDNDSKTSTDTVHSGAFPRGHVLIDWFIFIFLLLRLS